MNTLDYEITEPDFSMHTDTVQEAVELIKKAEEIVFSGKNSKLNDSIAYYYSTSDANKKYVGHLKQLINK